MAGDAVLHDAGTRRVGSRLDHWMIQWMATYGVRLIQTALAIIFIWFGWLRVVGRSPVAELVARTVPWIAPDRLLMGLGVWEMVVGLGLLFGVALRLTLLLF